jgi:hypothetical protein
MKKDPFALGVLAAWIANTIVNGLDFLVYSAQLTSHPIWHLAASVYLPIKEDKTLIGRIIGLVTDYAVAAGLSIILIYILYQTGKDYFYLKGLVIGLFAWVFIFGVVLRTGIARIVPEDPITNLFQLSNHLLLGVVMGWLLYKFLPEHFAE